MIFFAELFMTRGQHAPFNAAMLQVLQKAYPAEELVVYAAQSHWTAIQAVDPTLGSRISFRACRVKPISTGNKWQWLKKLLNEAAQLWRLMRIAGNERPSLLCYAFLSPLSQWLLSKYLKFFYPQQRVLVCLHGLEILQPGKPVKFIDRCYRYFLQKAFQCKSPHKTYAVFVHGAQDYLQQQGYLAVGELLYLPHPAIFRPIVHKQLANDTPLVFGHLGIARLAKQSHLFFALAAHFQQAVKAGKIRFEVIGPVLPEMKAHLNPWVSYSSGETFLTRAAYEAACQNIHYAVFCYDAASYELTSSGAVLDAITFRKPILALRNSSFQYLFEQTAQAPGELFDTLDDIQQGIQYILDQQSQANEEEYAAAFSVLQEYHSVDNVAKRLKEVMSDEL